MVEVPEVFPEGCDHHGTKVIQFLIKIAFAKKRIICSYFLIQLVHEVGVGAVHDGVLVQHRTVLKQFLFQLADA